MAATLGRSSPRAAASEDTRTRTWPLAACANMAERASCRRLELNSATVQVARAGVAWEGGMSAPVPCSCSRRVRRCVAVREPVNTRTTLRGGAAASAARMRCSAAKDLSRALTVTNRSVRLAGVMNLPPAVPSCRAAASPASLPAATSRTVVKWVGLCRASAAMCWGLLVSVADTSTRRRGWARAAGGRLAGLGVPGSARAARAKLWATRLLLEPAPAPSMPDETRVPGMALPTAGRCSVHTASYTRRIQWLYDCASRRSASSTTIHCSAARLNPGVRSK